MAEAAWPLQPATLRYCKGVSKPKRSPHAIAQPHPRRRVPESAISLADLGAQRHRKRTRNTLVQSGFGLHVRLGKDGDQGLRSEDEIAELVRRALYHRKSLTLHIEF